MTIGSLALVLPTAGGIFAIVASDGEPGRAATDQHTSAVTSGSTVAASPYASAGATGAAINGTTAGLGGAPGSMGADGIAAVAGATAGPAGSSSSPSGPGMPVGGTPGGPTVGHQPGPSSPPAPSPVVTTSTVTETEAIPYETTFVRDPSMPRHTYEERVPGEEGVKTLTYEVTTTDGQQTDKRLVSEEVTKAPVTRVIAVGTGRRYCDGDGDGPGDDSGGTGGQANYRRCEPTPQA